MCHQEKSKPRIRKTDAGKNSQNKGYTTAKKKKKRTPLGWRRRSGSAGKMPPLKKSDQTDKLFIRLVQIKNYIGKYFT